MTDFPVSNMNPDGMFVFGMIRAFGVEPLSNGTGFLIDLTKLNTETLPAQLATPLLTLSLNQTQLDLSYHAFNDGHLTVQVITGTEKVIEVLSNRKDCRETISFNKVGVTLSLVFTEGETLHYVVKIQ